MRRSVEDPKELTAYTVFCVEGMTLGALARVAGSRWRVKIGFEEAKGVVGLAHYEVRSWHGWHRHVVLSLFAHAFLAAIRAEGIDIEASLKGLRNWRASAACWRSRESEASRATDGLRSAQAPAPIGLGSAASAAGRSAPLVSVAS